MAHRKIYKIQQLQRKYQIAYHETIPVYYISKHNNMQILVQ